MFDWQNAFLDTLNLVVILAASGFLVRDTRRIMRRHRLRLFGSGVGEG
ncbi:MAG: hypothetical protein RR740_00410 [Pseudomonas sp.]